MDFDKKNVEVGEFTLLPTSGATFPTGEHYRIELVGPNNARTLRAFMELARKYDVPVRRFVGTLGGLDKLSSYDARDLVSAINNDYDIEYIATPIWPLTGVAGVLDKKHPCEASFWGVHLTSDALKAYMYQLRRGIDFGFNHFLIWDTAALDEVDKLRAKGEIPDSIRFKVSIFAGVANVSNAEDWLYRYNRKESRWSLASSMVGSINPVPLSISGLAELRQALAGTPVDAHATTLNSMLGLDRIVKEAHEIIRVASPVYIKIERGDWVASMMDEATLLGDVLPRTIASARKLSDHMRLYPEFRMAPVKK